MLQRVLRLFIGGLLRLYYRRIRVVNFNNLNVRGAKIVVANHPNTLMDAWLVGWVCKEPVYFLSKATFFNAPWKSRLLNALGMIPINRSSDKVTAGVSNAQSFEACYQLLERGKTLVIFPEGTSFLERRLRTLKPGASRIALEIAHRNTVEIHVIPVGLNYMQANKFRSRVEVEIGKPIRAKDYLLEGTPKNEAVKRLTEQIRVGLERVLISTQKSEDEWWIEQIAHLIHSRYQKERGSLSAQLLRKVRNRWEEMELIEPYHLEEIKREVEDLQRVQAQLNLRLDFLDRRFRLVMFVRQILFSAIGILLSAPLFVFGLLHNWLPYWLTDKLVPLISSEKEYYAPLAVLVSLLLYPSYYFALYALIHPHFLSAWWSVPYLVLMPLSGLFAYYMFWYLRHVWSKWTFVRNFFRFQTELLTIKQKRDYLTVEFLGKSAL